MMSEKTQRRFLLALSVILCLLQQILPALLVAGVALFVVRDRKTSVKVLQPFALLLSVMAVKGAFGLVFGLISEITALSAGGAVAGGTGALLGTVTLLGWTATAMTVVDMLGTVWLVLFLILGLVAFCGKGQGDMPLYGDLIRKFFPEKEPQGDPVQEESPPPKSAPEETPEAKSEGDGEETAE